MKRKLFKIFAPLLLIITVLGGMLLGTGCYVIRGVKMSKLVGTYELKTYTADVDRKTEREIEFYMVIRKDGTGFSVYKDKDTQLQCNELRCRFTPGQEDSSVYEYVECDFDGTFDWIKFGVNDKNLNFSKIKWNGKWPPAQEFTYSVRMEKVSSKTDYSYVNDKYDTQFTALPYGHNNAYGGYEFSYIECEPNMTPESYGIIEPVYACFTLNGYTGKANVRYMMPTDEVQHELTLDTSVSGGTYASNGAYVYDVTISEDTYQVESWVGSGSASSSLRVMKTYVVDGEEKQVAWVFNRSRSDVNYDFSEEIASKLERYQEQKAEQTPDQGEAA